jgi:DNA polymerase-3 subunit epsilon
MADAEMATNLTTHLAHDLLVSLQKVPAAKINEHLKRHRGF